MITQSLNNITQSGASDCIDLVASYTAMTPQQFYIVVGCATLILLFIIYMLFSTLRGYVTKSCVGCKRLKKCEEDLKKVKILQRTYGRNLGIIHKLLDKMLGEIKK